MNIQINIKPLNKGYTVIVNGKEYQTSINQYGTLFIVDKVSPSVKKLILAALNYMAHNICA